MAEPVTVQHLERFKEALITEMEDILNRQGGIPRWLRSHQLRKILSISHGKLQQLRSSGILPYSRIGNVILYDYKDIESLIRTHKQSKRR